MPSSERPHILVVGEDMDLTHSICRTLDRERFRCSGAAGSREAIAVARRTGVAVALVDVTDLGPAGGFRLAERLRHESRDLGVVLIAASRSLDDLVEALRIGIVDFLAKPVSYGEVADAVNRAMEWRETVQQSRGAMPHYEDEIAERAVRIRGVLARAGISSSRHLQECLVELYGPNLGALEHARRVAATARRLSQALDIAEPQLGHIERAALLHDIGKLVIPRAILGKAWPLSAGEQVIVRAHVRVAEETLGGVPFLAPTAEIVGATRERFDGRGYPRRLRGTAIPAGARIIAVAEAIDSLCGGAAASAPTALGAAADRLARHAGTWFDPRVVNVWRRCVDAADGTPQVAGTANTLRIGGPAPAPVV